METFPEALTTGLVQYEGTYPLPLHPSISRSPEHNIFSPQPTRSSPPAIFLMRMIAHDWGDESLSQIFRHLRDAAGLNTQLFIQDNVLLNACHGDLIPSDVKTSPKLIPPIPLLRNWGKSVPYLADIKVSLRSILIRTMTKEGTDVTQPKRPRAYTTPIPERPQERRVETHRDAKGGRDRSSSTAANCRPRLLDHSLLELLVRYLCPALM